MPSDPLVYKIYHVNNSFKDVIESLLIDTVYKNYKMDEEIVAEYSTNMQPDEIKIDYGKGFVKPDFIYVKIYVESIKLRMLGGYGWLYKVYISGNNKIYVFWTTSVRIDLERNSIKYNNVNVRKNKLKKLNQTDILNYELNNI